MIRGSTIRMRKRILFIAVVVIFVFFSILIVRLIKLQIVNGPYLFKMATSQQLSSTKLSPKRGTIFDRNMVPLAQSANVWNVVLEPNYIKDDETRELICKGLHEILDIPLEKIQNLSKKRSFYTVVKKKVESDIKDKILDFKNKNNITNGIRLIEDYKRYYPKDCLASTTLGFTGNDGQGLAGLESYYDKTLRGEPGKLVCAKNAIGTDMPYDYEHMIPPVNGKNLVLTIDSTIQAIAEEHLRRAIEKNDVRNRGVAIAIDPKTGEILALAVEKGFNPNKPFELYDQNDINTLNNTPEDKKSKVKSDLLARQWRNKAISDNYYPGSVFKTIVASMGFELGLVNEDSSFNCPGGIQVAERMIKCHKRSGHGTLSFVDAFCNSCNPAFISLGQRVGPSNFLNFYKSFGFDEKTGIDLPGETSDIFFSGGLEPAINLAVASIGQNFGITSMQMALATCAVANGGNLVTPHIVKEIVDDDGNIVQSFSTKVKRQVISKQTANRVSSMMANNTLSSGYKNAYVPGIRSACKTGTAEKKGQMTVPGEKDYISSCCGFAPVEDPKILLLIYLDTPKGGQYYGGAIASPIFSGAMQEIAPYMGISPKYNDDEMEKYGIDVPNFVGKKVEEAKNESINLCLEPVIIGNGDTIVSQIPSSGEKIAKYNSIVLYTDKNSEEQKKVKVPNFIGLKKSEALKIAESIELNLSISGPSDDEKSVIVSQSVPESDYVDRGTTINILFKIQE